MFPMAYLCNITREWSFIVVNFIIINYKIHILNIKEHEPIKHFASNCLPVMEINFNCISIFTEFTYNNYVFNFPQIHVLYNA